MDVRCNNCSKEYHIPDDSVMDKKVHFYCSQCGNKIDIPRKRSLTPDTGTIERKRIPVFSDIIEAVALSFGLIPFLISFIFCAGSSAVIFIASVLYFKQSDFFLSNPEISGVLASLLAALLIYGYSLLLYMISKIQMFRAEYGENTPIDWNFVLFNIKEDAIPLLLFPLGTIFALLVLLFPISFLGEYWIIYAALIFPVILILSLILIACLFLQNFIPAIVATQSFSPIDSCIHILRFIKREIVNIPFYLFFTKIVFLPVGIIVLIISVLSIALSADLVALFAGNQIAQIPVSVFSTFVSGSSTIPFHVTSGIIITIFFVLIILLIIASYLITLLQTICAQSCRIMILNPRKSVPRSLILTIMAFAFIIFTILLITALVTVGHGIFSKFLNNF